MNYAVWIVSAVPIVATLLPLIDSGRNWIRVWDYPRLQLAILLAVMAVVQAVLLPGSAASRGLLLATVACLVWQLWQIHLYTPAARVQVLPARDADPAHTIGVLIANVLQTNRNAPALLQRIADCDPDIILALETDAWWDAQLSPLAERYAFVVREPLDNLYGMIVYSRLQLEDAKVLYRVEEDIPSISARVRLRSGDVIDLHCLHPEPPQIDQDVDERDAELLIVGKEAAASARPVIVCGDLNDVAWSRSTRLFQRISGLLDPRVGRGLYATFHADHWFLRWPLDHLFHDASFTLRRLQVLDSIGSDHFPIFVQLVHMPAAATEQEAPAADEDDRREAAEKIEDGVEKATQTARLAML
jgi:endonuclease/exonuclease/phosphatase (EEP) superfamily protein YafD